MDKDNDPKDRPIAADRLTRELWRQRLRSRGLWAAAATLALFVVIFTLALLDKPRSVRHLLLTAGPTTVLPSDDGATPVLRVELDGQPRMARMGSRLVHPTPGEPVCIAVSERRLSGRMTLRVAPRTRCADTSATEDVE
ncbi:hypothetical protein [Salibaculum griseiflavum]|uniref:Uncharacterized protein n=1 Tax=Salibaculum griseiflavum TaxID=1914409 RepID=A0A2V1NZB9_9RHOB|nr:hypothetical protein [Salibaculum griseiflavum]PWG15661.1 hypothetical protein DFK10_15695 [Salibaculum griseiflavum]